MLEHYFAVHAYLAQCNKQFRSTSLREIEREIVTDKAWKEWQSLLKRADAVQIVTPEIKRDETTLDDLREAYKELKTIVDNAEAQAKAGE